MCSDCGRRHMLSNWDQQEGHGCANPRRAAWKTMAFMDLKHLAAWHTIKTIKAAGCMKLFKATRRVVGEVTCFLVPPAFAQYSRRPDQTESLELTTNYAVLSKARAAARPPPPPTITGLTGFARACTVRDTTCDGSTRGSGQETPRVQGLLSGSRVAKSRGWGSATCAR